MENVQRPFGFRLASEVFISYNLLPFFVCVEWILNQSIVVTEDITCCNV